MRIIAFAILVVAAATALPAQPQTAAVGAGATNLSGVSNLPVAKIGDDDLIGVMVYDAPEFTRTFRVSAEGDIRLPMVKQRIHAAGLYPEDLEKVITTALVNDNVLVDPVVSVSIIEYRSRPITVVGAVRSPVSFQATGTVTLLDAISQAGGLAENAGSEILVSHQSQGPDGKPSTLVQRISVRGLLDRVVPSLNLILDGGDEIRVPEAGKVYVLGDVKKPGFYYITDDSQSSVMKALALSSGLDQHPGHVAYIYRVEGGAGGRNEIPVQLKKIMDRKSPDVALTANDILYIPDASGRRVGLKILQASLPIAAALGTTLLYIGLR